MKIEIIESSEQFKKERLERLYRDAIDPNNIPPWIEYRNEDYVGEKPHKRDAASTTVMPPLGK
ncbi:MAG: hypothetical protein LBN12_04735 [Clostridiales Family XIII bacterium]|nr:hypothetical protein [Clostridiales Family XIII bacterium]